MNNIKIFADSVEKSAMDQINLLMEQPAFSDAKVRIMPDVHAGKGCVIGFTADMGDKIIPNIVGVDIGCGMLAVENHLHGCYDPEDCTNDIERAEMLGEITGINLMADEMLRRIKQAKEEE